MIQAWASQASRREAGCWPSGRWFSGWVSLRQDVCWHTPAAILCMGFPASMDFPHLHLLLNHFPIIGTIVGVGLFLISFLVKTDDVRRSSLIVFVVMALLTIPAFMTGVGAQEKMVTDSSVSNTLIQRHEGAAELAVWFMEITGALAVVGLWQSARRTSPGRLNTTAILAFSLVTAGLMARTGNTGGEIRHLEVRSAQEGTASEAAMAYFEP